MAQINMDMSNVEEMSERPVLPPGEYRVCVESSKVMTTKEKGKLMATFALRLEGNEKFNGLVLFENFVLENEVAQKRLKALAIAAGHPNPNYVKDTEELHGKSLLVSVKVKNDDKYGEQNNISAFKSLTDKSAQTPQGSETKKTTAAPWR